MVCVLVFCAHPPCVHGGGAVTHTVEEYQRDVPRKKMRSVHGAFTEVSYGVATGADLYATRIQHVCFGGNTASSIRYFGSESLERLKTFEQLGFRARKTKCKNK